MTLAYSIGKAQPVMLSVDTFSTGTACDDDALSDALKVLFDLTPSGIISRFRLFQFQYAKTARLGHFGNPEFPWERTDQASRLREAIL